MQGQHGNRHAEHGDQGKSPRGYGEGSPGSVLLAVAQGELVQQVLCQAGFRSAHLAQLGDVVPQLFDEHHLLLQVVTLQEIAQVAVPLLGGLLVQIEQALVHHDGQVQGALQGLQAALPVVAVRPADVAQADSGPALVLQLHQPLRQCLLLARPLQEELGQVLARHAIEIGRHGRVHVGGVELQGDVGVDGGLTLGVVVLAHVRGSGWGRHVWRCGRGAPRRRLRWKRRRLQASSGGVDGGGSGPSECPCGG